MDVQKEIQKATKQRECVGVFIETEECSYFTDESPEHHNTPGNRFVMMQFQHEQRERNGHPAISPRYFRETTTTIVNREEITEEEWLKLQTE